MRPGRNPPVPRAGIGSPIVRSCLSSLVLFACSCTGLELYNYSGTNHQPILPLVREQLPRQEPMLPAPAGEQSTVRVALEATARLGRFPYEVDWTGRVSGGRPPYVIASPSGPMSLAEAGEVSGSTAFDSNTDPWRIRIAVTDARGNEGEAHLVIEPSILAGSSVVLDGERLVPGAKRYSWKQVHNPDRYTGWEYITGNDAEISGRRSPSPTATFTWPGRYRFSLTTAGPDGTESSRNIDLVVRIARSPFKLRGACIGLTEGRYLEGNLDRIRDWGGNFVRYSFSLYVLDPNASVIMPSWELPRDSVIRPPTPRDEQLAEWIRQAHARGLGVLLAPSVVWLGVMKGDQYTRSTYAEPWQMNPSDWSAWFHSWEERMMQYAEIAEKTGVEILSIGSDLGLVQYTPNVWRQMIAAVRNVYHGNVTITETPGWGYRLPVRPGPPDFLYDINLMHYDFNYPGSENQLHPQVPDMAYRFWQSLNGSNSWMAVPYMRQFKKTWLVNAYAIPNGDGVNRYLQLHGERPDEGPLRIDNQEPVDYLEAEFRALARLAESDVGDRFLGALVWYLSDWKVPFDRVDWGIADRPVEQVLPLWFSSASDAESR
jgi:hypothetical protein